MVVTMGPYKKMNELPQEILDLIKSNPKALSKAMNSIGLGNAHSASSSMGEQKISFDIKPLPEDFRELQPGTHDWGRYWRAHPEKQVEMLKQRNA